MRQPPRFGKPLLAIPADERIKADQHDYATAISPWAGFGFAVLVTGLSIATFCLTIWGGNLSIDLKPAEAATIAVPIPLSVVERDANLYSGDGLLLEPKTAARLPRFGGVESEDL